MDILLVGKTNRTSVRIYGTAFRLARRTKLRVDADDTADEEDGASPVRDRPRRADARRNLDTLLRTAAEVFATAGVDAPMRAIAERAGVGVGTIYRHFPQRADLVAAVFRREVDACAEAASLLAAEHRPGAALDRWMQRYVDFIVAKRGLAAALYSGAAAFQALPAYFDTRLEPALRGLLDSAAAAGDIPADVVPGDLLRAVASLCSSSSDGDPAPARRLVALLVDGLRFRAARS